MLLCQLICQCQYSDKKFKGEVVMSHNYSKKEKKKGQKYFMVSARSITIACVVIVLFICVSIYGALEVNGVIDDIFRTKHLDMTDVQNNITKAVSKYDYAFMVVDQQYVEPGFDETYNTQYALSGAKNSTYMSYIFRDSEDNSLYQSWAYNDVTNKYNIWLYSDYFDAWVQTYNETKPMDIDMWNPIPDMSHYDLLDDSAYWPQTNDECYVFYTIINYTYDEEDDVEFILSQNPYSKVFETLYIRKSDWIPMGIVIYANDDTGKTKVTEVTDMNVLSNYFGDQNISVDEHNIASAQVEEAEYNEMLIRYSFSYSNEDMSLFQIPDEYITEEQYFELVELEVGSYNSEVEEEVEDVQED